MLRWVLAAVAFSFWGLFIGVLSGGRKDQSESVLFGVAWATFDVLFWAAAAVAWWCANREAWKLLGWSSRWARGLALGLVNVPALAFLAWGVAWCLSGWLRRASLAEGLW